MMPSYKVPQQSTIPVASTPDPERPIPKPLKKRRCTIDAEQPPAAPELLVSNSLLSDKDDQILGITGADLRAWKGQHILARNGANLVYQPGVIKSIATSNHLIEVLLDGETNIRFYHGGSGSEAEIVGDYAPSAAAVVENTRVCVRLDCKYTDFHVGTVCGRNAQSMQFSVKLDSNLPTAGKEVVVSRANLRLLQVFRNRLWCFSSF